jgi:hypothetical protein
MHVGKRISQSAWKQLVVTFHAPSGLPHLWDNGRGCSWSTGKSPRTISYAWYLSERAKLLSMQEVAIQFKVSWHHVCSAIAKAVAWGRECMDLTTSQPSAYEIHWSAKNGFMTLVYQIDNHCKRLSLVW